MISIEHKNNNKVFLFDLEYAEKRVNHNVCFVSTCLDATVFSLDQRDVVWEDL
jgi:hypothetical protein